MEFQFELRCGPLTVRYSTRTYWLLRGDSHNVVQYSTVRQSARPRLPLAPLPLDALPVLCLLDSLPAAAPRQRGSESPYPAN